MARAGKPQVPTKSTNDQHFANEVNNTDVAIDEIIDDYVSQTETTEQDIASDLVFASGKKPKTDSIAEGTDATGVTVDGCLIKDGQVADTLAIAEKTVNTDDRADDTILVYDETTDTYLHEGFPIAGIADQVWNEATADHISAGSFGKALADLITESGTHPTLAEIEAGDLASVLANTKELQEDWVNGGRLDLLVDAIKTQTDKIREPESDTTSSPFTLQNNTDEQTIIEITPSVYTRYGGIMIDIDALTQIITAVKVYFKVDGSNYRENTSMRLASVPASIPMLFLKGFESDVGWKITIQMSVLEGATRSIPYRILQEENTS